MYNDIPLLSEMTVELNDTSTITVDTLKAYKAEVLTEYAGYEKYIPIRILKVVSDYTLHLAKDKTKTEEDIKAIIMPILQLISDNVATIDINYYTEAFLLIAFVIDKDYIDVETYEPRITACIDKAADEAIFKSALLYKVLSAYMITPFESIQKIKTYSPQLKQAITERNAIPEALL
jgi:hypothetical protein